MNKVHNNHMDVPSGDDNQLQQEDHRKHGICEIEYESATLEGQSLNFQSACSLVEFWPPVHFDFIVR